MLKKNELSDIELPPRLPADEDELHLAVTLLGNRKQSELGAQARHKLECLLGVYPTVEQAARWKQVLRRIHKSSSVEGGEPGEIKIYLKEQQRK